MMRRGGKGYRLSGLIAIALCLVSCGAAGVDYAATATREAEIVQLLNVRATTLAPTPTVYAGIVLPYPVAPPRAIPPTPTAPPNLQSAGSKAEACREIEAMYQANGRTFDRRATPSAVIDELLRMRGIDPAISSIVGSQGRTYFNELVTRCYQEL